MPAPVAEPIPDKAILKVVIRPSRPPYTADLIYYPALTCFYAWICSVRLTFWECY